MKLSTRIIYAINRGFHTSREIAAHIEAEPKAVTSMLADMFQAGSVARTEASEARKGRPAYHYTLKPVASPYVRLNKADADVGKGLDRQ